MCEVNLNGWTTTRTAPPPAVEAQPAESYDKQQAYKQDAMDGETEMKETRRRLKTEAPQAEARRGPGRPRKDSGRQQPQEPMNLTAHAKRAKGAILADNIRRDSTRSELEKKIDLAAAISSSQQLIFNPQPYLATPLQVNQTPGAAYFRAGGAEFASVAQQFASLHSLSAIASVLQKQQQQLIQQQQQQQQQQHSHLHENNIASLNGPAGSSIRRNKSIKKEAAAGELDKEPKKCRKTYGMHQRKLWCLQCRWKKACSRFSNPKKRYLKSHHLLHHHHHHHVHLNQHQQEQRNAPPADHHQLGNLVNYQRASVPS